MLRNKILYSVMGSVAVLSLLGGAVAMAQPETPVAVAAADSASSIVLVQDSTESDATPEAQTDTQTSIVDRDQYLADALGITLEELATAEEAARIAMIDQAVADGLLTEAEGEALKLESGRGFRRLSAFYDKDEFLADALGITVEALEAAELEAYEAELADRVAAGELTQEEADLKLAQKVAQSYLDTDAIEAQVQSALEAAVAEALADGTITQAQADALLAQLEAQPYQFHGGFGGGRGHGGRGGDHGGRGFDSLPTIPETSPDSSTGATTDTALDA